MKQSLDDDAPLVLSAEGVWLQHLAKWQWFAGYSFRTIVSWDTAQQAMVDYVARLARKTHHHVLCAWAVEAEAGSHHLHALIEVIDGAVTSKVLQHVWRSARFPVGYSDIRKFDPNRRGGEYVVKFGSVDIYVGCTWADPRCTRRGCAVHRRLMRKTATLRGRHRVALLKPSPT